MKRAVYALALTAALVLVSAIRVEAAIAVVQVASGRATDPVLTFGSAMGASNHIVVVAFVNNNSSTLTITGVTNSVTTLLGPTDIGTVRAYAFCFQGDGSDTSFTVDSPAGVQVAAAAAEISGGSCTADGTSANAAADGTSPYNLTTLLTTSQSGSFIIGMVHSTSTSDYSADTGVTSIPADGTDLAVALGGYRIAGAAGNYDLPFTSSPNETTSMFAVSVKEAAAGGATPNRKLLLGVGRPR